MRHLAIPLIARRASGLYIRVVESDGVLERARWVGPFADAEAIVDWLELCALEDSTTELLSPLDIGLPMELAFVRPSWEQARTARLALAARLVAEERKGTDDALE
jgi:hypothetical protein